MIIKKALPIVGIVFAAALCYAGETGVARVGGRVTKPGSCKGSIGIVNVQEKVDKSVIEATVKVIRDVAPYNIRVVEGKLSGYPTKSAVSACGFDIAIYVVDNADKPDLVVAPDDRWALVNVMPLSEGLTVEKKSLLEKRLRGQVMRAFAMVCGAATSQYPGNIHNATSVSDLDSLNPDQMIHDVMQRVRKNLTSIGITEPYVAVYKKAAAEGWAPPPTNEVQKAIWDRFHQAPTNGIEIKFDPKKGK